MLSPGAASVFVKIVIACDYEVKINTCTHHPVHGVVLILTISEDSLGLFYNGSASIYFRHITRVWS